MYHGENMNPKVLLIGKNRDNVSKVRIVEDETLIHLSKHRTYDYVKPDPEYVNISSSAISLH